MSTGSLRRIGVDFIQTHFGISQLLGLSNGTDELTDLQVLRAYTAPGGERLKSGALRGGRSSWRGVQCCEWFGREWDLPRSRLCSIKLA